MKYHFAADLHTHTLASGHAYGTIRENVEGARAAGIQVLGATEHAPGIPGTVDPFYYRNIKVVPKRIHVVSILHGSEINVLEDGTLSLEAQFMKYLDYAIVGIHTVCYHDQGRRKNTDNVIACMQHPKVKIVSHPDDDHTPLDYERLVAAAKQYNVALEVNNSSFKKPDRRINCLDNYRTMLGLCTAQRVPIVVDTDAHDPSAVGRMDLAAAFLESVRMDPELILNLRGNLEKLMAFLRVDNEMPYDAK